MVMLGCWNGSKNELVLSEWGPEIYMSKAIDCIACSVSETEIDTAIFWINILD